MKRRRNAKDSLDLLLDTICNAFGGLIFIALLVAIMAQVNHEEEAQRRRVDAATIKKQLLLAQKTKEELTKQKAELAEKTGETMAQRILEFEKTAKAIGNAEARLALMREASATKSAELARGVSQLAGDVMSRLRTARLEKEQLLLDIAQKTQGIENGADKEVALTQEIKDEQEKLNLTVRLPREKGAGSGVFMIIRHGRIYPVDDAFISWLNIRELDANSAAFWPQQGGGWELPADSEKLNSFLRSQSRGVAAMLYQDSFHVYPALRACVAEAQVPWAWSPMVDDQPLVLTTSGGTRPEQQ